MKSSFRLLADVIIQKICLVGVNGQNFNLPVLYLLSVGATTVFLGGGQSVFFPAQEDRQLFWHNKVTILRMSPTGNGDLRVCLITDQFKNESGFILPNPMMSQLSVLPLLRMPNISVIFRMI